MTAFGPVQARPGGQSVQHHNVEPGLQPMFQRPAEQTALPFAPHVQPGHGSGIGVGADTVAVGDDDGTTGELPVSHHSEL